jgi:predicted DNA-binding WGR domain protein
MATKKTARPVDTRPPIQTVDQLMKHFGIEDIAVIENTSDNHDKLYVIMTAKSEDGAQMARFWGRWGKALSPKVEHIQGGEFDAILDSKIKEGYEPVENYDRLEGCGYVETIAQTLDENIEIY